MKLEGSLDAFSLPDVFQLLSLTRKSGGLHLRSTDGALRGVVYFVEGSVSSASADASRQSLARRLVGSGAIDDGTLTRAIQTVSEGGGFGAALKAVDGVEDELLRAAATEQTVDAVFDLLCWTDGDFAFGMDEADPDDVGIRLACDAIVAEAASRRGAWDAATQVVPGPGVVLGMPVVLGGEPQVTRDEWALLALVDGRRTVSDLVDITGCGQFAVVSTLASLVERGLLEVLDDARDDHVRSVTRRHALLAAVETAPPAPPAAPVQVAAPEPAPRQPDRGGPARSSDPVRSATGSAGSTADGDDEDDDDDEGWNTVGPARTATAEHVEHERVEHEHVGQAEDAEVVPARPEPFLPRRSPDFSEAPVQARSVHSVPAMASAGSGPHGSVVGATAVAADPATSLIERDPSVNRSLLLRLIAGVRGL